MYEPREAFAATPLDFSGLKKNRVAN